MVWVGVDSTGELASLPAAAIVRLGRAGVCGRWGCRRSPGVEA